MDVSYAFDERLLLTVCFSVAIAWLDVGASLCDMLKILWLLFSAGKVDFYVEECNLVELTEIINLCKIVF